MTDDIQIIREALAAGPDESIAQLSALYDACFSTSGCRRLERLLARLEAAETALALWEHAYESGCVDADLAAAYKATP